MEYISTRGNYQSVSSARAIQLGMVPSGGLFVPAEIPQLAPEEIYQLQELDYQQVAYKILSQYLTDYSSQELREAIAQAYNQDNFACQEITPLVELTPGEYILELWHGPTAAFKDLALQLMPHLLSRAVEKVGLEKEVVILVATSGDTGKAALEGFKDVPGVKIIVFYPDKGVSKIQARQMVTTSGTNTSVVAVAGNFDDCQSRVKEIFGDDEFKAELDQAGYKFSSANSINWGRLVPQIVYYFVSYSRLLADGQIESGAEIDITVPTGNFGNILAAYYAREMGLPVDRLVCASNDNKVLTDFLQTGVYDINREFKQTISPSMDILISSNLERFLFEVTDHNAEQINSWYQQLEEAGRFEVDETIKKELGRIFSGQYATETDCLSTIGAVYDRQEYLLDPHTAVGVDCYRQYQREAKTSVAIIASTASPYKFSPAVLKAITDQEVTAEDEFEILEALKAETGWEIHPALKGLESASIRHDYQASQLEIKEQIESILGL